VRTVAVYAASIVAGIVLGLASLYLALGQVVATGTVANGPWHTDPAIGSPSASAYLRAANSLAAVLALDSAEVLYFFAFTDSDGNALTARCSYTIEGSEPDARWWSITAYRGDGYLPPSANGRYSVNGGSVSHRSDGTFSAIVAGAGADIDLANRSDIALAGNRGFNLMLRLYSPGRGVSVDLARIALPAIRRDTCQ